MRLPLIICLFFIVECAVLNAQDLHFSQWHLLNGVQNPAHSAQRETPWRVGAAYRNQWASVPVNYTTAMVVWDQKWSHQYNRGGWASSLWAQYDFAGDSKLSWTQLTAQLAYGIVLNPRHIFSVGFQGALVQRAFKTSNLSFDRQFIDDQYQAQAPSLESFNQNSIFRFDMGAGIQYDGEISKTVAIRLGTGLHHINRPNYGFYSNNTVTLPFRWTYQASGLVGITSASEVQLQAMYSIQGKQQELLYGGLFRLFLNGDSREGNAIGLGIQQRQKDAWSPFVEIQYGNWTAGLSYDINFSEFKSATNRNGGPEIVIFYSPIKAPQLKVFKPCPVFVP